MRHLQECLSDEWIRPPSLGGHFFCLLILIIDAESGCYYSSTRAMKNSSIQSYFLLMLLLAALALAYNIFSAFLIPLTLAVVFAVTLQPVQRRVGARIADRSLASAVTFAIGIVCILAPLSFVGVLITNEAQQLYQSVQNGAGEGYLYVALTNAQQAVHAYLPQFTFPTNLYSYIDQYTRVALGWIVSNLGVIFSSVASVLLSLFLFAITM